MNGFGDRHVTITSYPCMKILNCRHGVLETVALPAELYPYIECTCLLYYQKQALSIPKF